MASLKERLIEVLLSRKLVAKAELDEVVAQQRAQGGSLQKLLVERKLVSETDLLAAISQGLGIPPISLSRMRPDPGLKGLISRELATQYELVPISCIGQTLTVAMADPLNIFALDTLTTMTGLSVNALLATSSDIREAIDHLYGLGVEESLREIVDKAESEALEVIQGSAAEKTDESDPARLLSQTQEAPVVKFTDALLTSAVRMHASDLLIEPREKTVRVRFRVDGVLQEGKAPSRQLHAGIVSRIKIMSELNIAERRLPQDGHFTFRVDQRAIDFRVSILPTSFGGNVAVRVLDKLEQSLAGLAVLPGARIPSPGIARPRHTRIPAGVLQALPTDLPCGGQEGVRPRRPRRSPRYAVATWAPRARIDLGGARTREGLQGNAECRCAQRGAEAARSSAHRRRILCLYRYIK